jgi:hypothetical protein
MPDRASTFAGAMKWHAMLPGYSPKYLASSFPWNDVDVRDSNTGLTVVDVGGGLGHVSMALANHSPTVKCTVQDSPNVVRQGRDALPPALHGRVTFQAHDFFQPQPIKGADVYLLRLVLHDWSDKYCNKIITALIPALKPGAKVVINDRVIPGRHEAHYLVERESRLVSLCTFFSPLLRLTIIIAAIMICTCLPFKTRKSGQPTIGLHF